MGKVKRKFSRLEIQKATPNLTVYCHTERLIIEIDGSIHELEEVKVNDEIRQKNLEDLGLKVLRFATKEITQNMKGVLKKIEITLIK
ncbi:MAG: DUF559 domain-containing protein [Ferruginibacter sp.]